MVSCTLSCSLKRTFMKQNRMYGSPMLLWSLLKKADGGIPCNFLFLLNHFANLKSFCASLSLLKSTLSAKIENKKRLHYNFFWLVIISCKTGIWLRASLPSWLQLAIIKYPPSGITGSIPASFKIFAMKSLFFCRSTLILRK